MLSDPGFVTIDAVQRWAAAQDLDGDDARAVAGLVDALAGNELERVMNRRIGTFVEACTLVERENFLSDLTNRYRYGVTIDPEIAKEQKLYARLAREVVFQSPQVCQLEHKGGFMLERIFGALVDNYLGSDRPQALLSRALAVEMEAAETEAKKARVICDYLAGMTDGFASRIYKRLFDPDYGSIVDLV